MAERLSLQRFLALLDRRLSELSAGEIRAAIRSRAESLPSEQRRSFLDLFAGTAPSTDAPEIVWPVESDPLLDEIDELVERISGGSYFEGFGWDDDMHDERSFGDESWVWEMDGLFADTQAAFLAGDLGLARAAYERLLHAFELDQDVGTFCGSSPAREMVSTDVAEAQARFLRAVYETTAPVDRASVLGAEWFEMPNYRAPTLAEVQESRAQDLPGLEAFLPEWIAMLGSIAAEQPGIESSARRLLAEAAEMHGGPDALAPLARNPGPAQGERFLEWVEALRRADRDADAASAAREALAGPSSRGTAYAQLAELLAELVPDDADAVLAARRAAWRAQPNDTRLLALHAAAGSDVDQVLDAEVLALASADPPVSGRLRAMLLLLAGRIDDAAGLPGRDDYARAPASQVVLPYLLAAGCGGPSHPSWKSTRVAQLLQGVDDSWRSDWTRPLGRDRDPDAPPTLSALLLERLAIGETDVRQRQRWVQLARSEIDRRVRAIVGSKRRSRYGEAARLAACCAEALSLAGDSAAGTSFVASLRGDFSRHTAFQRELNTATSTPIAPEQL